MNTTPGKGPRLEVTKIQIADKAMFVSSSGEEVKDGLQENINYHGLVSIRKEHSHTFLRGIIGPDLTVLKINNLLFFFPFPFSPDIRFIMDNIRFVSNMNANFE